MTSSIQERDAGNLWSRGIDWFVFKDGRKWRCAECFGIPHSFKTKTAAYDAGTKIVLETARRNALKRNTGRAA